MTVEPHLAATVRREGAGALAGYELTQREQDRLVSVSRQPGMDLNCTLARGNRFAFSLRIKYVRMQPPAKSQTPS